MATQGGLLLFQWPCAGKESDADPRPGKRSTSQASLTRNLLNVGVGVGGIFKEIGSVLLCFLMSQYGNMTPSAGREFRELADSAFGSSLNWSMMWPHPGQGISGWAQVQGPAQACPGLVLARPALFQTHPGLGPGPGSSGQGPANLSRIFQICFRKRLFPECRFFQVLFFLTVSP